MHEKETKGNITLYRRSKGGTWHYEFWIEGQRVRCSGKTKDKKLAEIAATEHYKRAYSDAALGIIRKEEVTLHQACIIFADEHLPRLRSKKDVAGFLVEITEVLGKAILLSEIANHHIQMLWSYWKGKERPNSDATGNRKLAALSTLMSFWRDVKGAAVSNVNISKHKRKERTPMTDYLTTEQIHSLLNVCPSYLRNMIICALNTGLRRDNVVFLRWDELNLDRGTITIQVKSSGEHRKRHTIPITHELHRLLNNLNSPRDGYVFLREDGHHVAYTDKVLRRCLRDAGITLAHGQLWHIFRHTAAKWMHHAGVDLVTICEVLGHSDIRTTRKYVSGTAEMHRDALNRIATNSSHIEIKENG